jgi:hypothetical protein
MFMCVPQWAGANMVCGDLQRPGEFAIMSAFSGNLSVVSFDLTFVPGALPTVMLAGYCDGIIRWYAPD